MSRRARAALGVLVVMAAVRSLRPREARAEAPDVSGYRETAEKILAAARGNRHAWERLAELTDTFGNRLSGSPQLEAALRWAAEEMKKDGLENVQLEPVMVPHWVRGRGG